MARKLTNIDKYAEKLMEGLPNRPYPGEMSYISTGARLIRAKLAESYKKAGIELEPPHLKTIQNWFYVECPPLAIALLHNLLVPENIKSDSKLQSFARQQKRVA